MGGHFFQIFHSFFCCLFQERPTTSFKASFPQRANLCSSFQFSFKLVQLLLTSSSTSSLPLISFPLSFLPKLCSIKQFQCKMLPIQCTSLFFYCLQDIPLLIDFLQCLFYTISPNVLRRLIPAPRSKTFRVFPIYFLKCPNFGTAQNCAPNIAFQYFFFKFSLNLLLKRAFFLPNAAFAIEILYLISSVYLAPFVIMLHKYFKYTTFSGLIYLSQSVLRAVFSRFSLLQPKNVDIFVSQVCWRQLRTVHSRTVQV